MDRLFWDEASIFSFTGETQASIDSQFYAHTTTTSYPLVLFAGNLK